MPSRDVHLVVPTLGTRPDYLASCIGSLLDQTYPVRVTVVGPAKRLSGSWLTSERVTLLPERGCGLSAAINQGWSADGWRSDFTGWLGDDDAVPPGSVAAAVAVLEQRPAAAMVHGRCLIVDAAGQPTAVIRHGRLGSAFAGYGRNLIGQPGSLFRTARVQQIGGLDESLAYAMDVDLFLRLRRVGQVTETREQLGVFREHAGGLSTAARRDAAREATAAMRRAHPRLTGRAVDRAAWLATWAVGQVTSRLPPRPASYWRPL